MVNIYTYGILIVQESPQNPNCLCQVSHELNGANRGSAGVIITHESEQTGHWKI